MFEKRSMKPDPSCTKLYREIVKTRAHAPSLNCLATWAGMPYSTAHDALKRLEARGRVRVFNRGHNRRDGSQLVVLPIKI